MRGRRIYVRNGHAYYCQFPILLFIRNGVCERRTRVPTTPVPHLFTPFLPIYCVKWRIMYVKNEYVKIYLGIFVTLVFCACDSQFYRSLVVITFVCARVLHFYLRGSLVLRVNRNSPPLLEIFSKLYVNFPSTFRVTNNFVMSHS